MYVVKMFDEVSNGAQAAMNMKRYVLLNHVEDYDAAFVRYEALTEEEFPDSLLCIARAGFSTINIPVEECTEKGIVVFHTPGATANGVMELTICSILLSSRKILEGANWMKSLKGQNKIEKIAEHNRMIFSGSEISGKKLGVIGLGAVGTKVANTAAAMGMEVLGYDPYISAGAALSLNGKVKYKRKWEELIGDCDYLTFHVPVMEKTEGFINKDMLEDVKKGVRIINLADGRLVQEENLKEALENGTVSSYVSDFASDLLLSMDNVIFLPHMGGETKECSDRSTRMALEEIWQYLEYGTIRNSVNFPSLEVAYEGGYRICLLYHNLPNIISDVLGIINSHVINFGSRSKGEAAYTIVDLSEPLEEEKLTRLREIQGMLMVRQIGKEGVAETF